MIRPILITFLGITLGSNAACQKLFKKEQAVSPSAASPAMYTVEGSYPDGKGPYAGKVEISPGDGIYQLKWNAGTQSQGVGLVLGHLLALGLGDPAKPGYGVGVYTVGENGGLKGRWAMEGNTALGAETWAPGPRTVVQLGPGSATAVRVGGTYTVVGKNPGGKGGYHGTLTITPDGELFHLQWSVGTTYTGIGVQDKNVLVVGWGNLHQPGYGMVAYTVQANGILEGKWTTFGGRALGTETATPKK
ncbi:MAG: hypothetical protein HY543_07690 [Deltaproteobacteria bacterium]|nr:hypothetical protein [Deltaproteobacteria bacterium]